MDAELQAKVTSLKATGWQVKTVVNDNGITVYQLYNATGQYVVSNLSEETLWKRASKRELLPA